MGKKNNGNTDDDQFFLDQVLNGLYDFGGGAASKKQQKRKRTEVEEEDEAVAPGIVCVDTGDGGSEQRDAKDGQGKSQTDTSRSEPTGPPKHRIAQVEVVTYRDPAKKSKVKPTAPSDLKSPPKDSKKGKNNSDGAEEFTFEKARLEVHRFGIRGYEKEQQRSFEQERAIMLGAKPPKKDYINYKLLQQQVKEKKKAKVEVEPDLRKKKKQSKPRDKRKTSSGAVTGSGSSKLGQMGRFKDGMLILSSKDIDKIKGSKAK